MITYNNWSTCTFFFQITLYLHKRRDRRKENKRKNKGGKKKWISQDCKRSWRLYNKENREKRWRIMKKRWTAKVKETDQTRKQRAKRNRPKEIKERRTRCDEWKLMEESKGELKRTEYGNRNWEKKQHRKNQKNARKKKKQKGTEENGVLNGVWVDCSWAWGKGVMSSKADNVTPPPTQKEETRFKRSHWERKKKKKTKNRATFARKRVEIQKEKN